MKSINERNVTIYSLIVKLQVEFSGRIEEKRLGGARSKDRRLLKQLPGFSDTAISST